MLEVNSVVVCKVHLITLFCEPGQAQAELPKNAGEKTIAWLDKLRYASGDLPTSDIRNKMQRVMQNNAAVFRTQDTLEEGGCSFLIAFAAVLSILSDAAGIQSVVFCNADMDAVLAFCAL